MFEPTVTPRIYGVPLGVDFSQSLIDGLTDRLKGKPPQDWAKVQILVNTRRLQRRLIEVFQAGPPRLLPRIDLITDLPDIGLDVPVPKAVPSLHRQLEISQFVAQLLENKPDLAPRHAVFDLSVSLANLLEEMEVEGVPAENLLTLDPQDESGHWQRALEFIKIVFPFFDAPDRPSGSARQRLIATRLAERWQTNPPNHPVIIAGSTGSRGTAFELMQAVSKLPQGAVIVPGLDPDTPADVWDALIASDMLQDHPQHRFAALLAALDMQPNQLKTWSDNTAHNPARNALVSLSLRPAPVTYHWLKDGPKLTSLDQACEKITWLNAPDQRAEATAIALKLRAVAETGQTAAVITPDRTLTRRISAILKRWNITPDDSAGFPLAQSVPGRLLLHIFDTATPDITAEALMVLLKHPLVNSASDRGPHLKHTRDLELYLRNKGIAFVTPEALTEWAKNDDDHLLWVAWLKDSFFAAWPVGDQSIQTWLDQHIQMAEALSAGIGTEPGGLWDQAAGREAQALVEKLRKSADMAGAIPLRDYQSIFKGMISSETVRDQNNPHPNILIWGALEARVQGADLVILAGLNEGSWPEIPNPDPWLNRAMRKEVGLLLPERRIGLSAHDYQQAMAASEVWVTRALKSDDAEAVPARWLNRLSNLINGLSELDEHPLMSEMQARGEAWLDQANALDAFTPIDKYPRPSPNPPTASRPKKMSVTEFKTLIRDPYAVYAKHVLDLRPLNALVPEPDARARGILVHEIIAKALDAGPFNSITDGHQRLAQATQDCLDKKVPWPLARLTWQMRIEKVADWFIARQLEWQDDLMTSHFEVSGELYIPNLDFTISVKADRIDLRNSGAWIFDYKAGKPPTQPQQKAFDNQLLLEIEMLRRGAFKGLATKPILGASFVGLGNDPKEELAPHLDRDFWADFQKLLQEQVLTGRFTARRAMLSVTDPSDFDHLSRFGEWDATDPGTEEVLT